MSHKNIFEKLLAGYKRFRAKYASPDNNIMEKLSVDGQHPKIMVVACADSRVDPSLILQCDPGDLFVVRNVANIVPPYLQTDTADHHGMGAALKFAIGGLNVEHIVLLGHSQCGGIQALLNHAAAESKTDSSQPQASTDCIHKWVSIVGTKDNTLKPDDYAKEALHQSYDNCLSFPWVTDAVEAGKIQIHRWFFNIKEGEIQAFDSQKSAYAPLKSVVATLETTGSCNTPL